MGTKISGLPTATSIVGSDVLPIVNSNATKKVVAEKILMLKSLTDVKWVDIRTPVTSTKTGGSKDPDFIKMTDNGDSSQDVFAYAFDDSLEEELYFAIQLPHSYKYGTDILPHLHWSPSDTGVGNVKWVLEYIVLSENQVVGDTTIITKTVSLTGEKKHYFTRFGDVIDGSLIDSLSTMIMCRIARESASVSNYAKDVFLLEIDFHYQIDSIGSTTEFEK